MTTFIAGHGTQQRLTDKRMADVLNDSLGHAEALNGAPPMSYGTVAVGDDYHITAESGFEIHTTTGLGFAITNRLVYEVITMGDRIWNGILQDDPLLVQILGTIAPHSEGWSEKRILHVIQRVAPSYAPRYLDDSAWDA